MKNFTLTLRTPEKVVFEGEASLLHVNQADGSRSFLAGFENCLGSITQGVCYYIADDKEVKFVTADGFFLVKNGSITLNSPIIEYGDDPQEVMKKYEITSKELRNRYLKSKQEYLTGKIELAKAISGKKQNGDA